MLLEEGATIGDHHRGPPSGTTIGELCCMKLREQDLTWQEIDEEIVILDLRASSYLKLNGTAAFLWKRLESGAESEDLVGALTSNYEVDDGVARRDVDAFIRQLRRADLLADST
jgi:hypothetical protein